MLIVLWNTSELYEMYNDGHNNKRVDMSVTCQQI